MNDRFLSLVDKAQELSYKEYEKRLTGYSREDLFNRIFAELIVRECTNRLTQNDFSSAKGIMRIAGAKLKEHFGVE